MEPQEVTDSVSIAGLSPADCPRRSRCTTEDRGMTVRPSGGVTSDYPADRLPCKNGVSCELEA